MPRVSTRIQPIDRDLRAIVDQELSPKAQSAALAQYAREQLVEAQAQNRSALGAVPVHETFVDGRASERLDDVKPDGTIVFVFELLDEVLDWIGEMLVTQSPVLTGRYANSHMLFAGGVDATGRGVVNAEEFTFANTMPYARKIERGLSPQAPDGVYEAVAAMAAGRFGNIATIFFTYRAVFGMNVVNGDLAASSGRWRRGGIGSRAATGAFEMTLAPGAHNKADVRFPAIVVRIG